MKLLDQFEGKSILLKLYIYIQVTTVCILYTHIIFIYVYIYNKKKYIRDIKFGRIMNKCLESLKHFFSKNFPINLCEDIQ